MMRRTTTLAAALAATRALGLGAASSVSAGTNGPSFELFVRKVVEGTQTEPGLFEVTVVCDGQETVLPVAAGGVVVADANFRDTCTVTETESRGGVASYSCEEVEFTTCNADNQATFDGSDNGGEAEITVTNTYEEPPPPPPPPPPPEPQPVEVEPAFTG